MNRNWLYGGLVVFAACLLVSTGGFSSVSANRNGDVTVADGQNAYLGIGAEYEVSGVVGGEPETALELSDNFGQTGVRLRASVSEDDLTADASFADGLEIGCRAVLDEPAVPVEITAIGDEIRVTLTRTVDVTCRPPPITPDDVTFYGCGNAAVAGHESQFPLEVTLIGVRQNPDETFTTTDRAIDEPGDRSGGTSGQLAGLKVRSQRYVDGFVVTNPNYVDGTCNGSADGNPATGERGDPRD